MYDSCLSSSDETIQNLSIAIQVMRRTNITVDIYIINYLIGFLAVLLLTISKCILCFTAIYTLDFHPLS